MSDSRSVTLEVAGMTCGSCSARVDRALKAVEGVESVAVNVQQGTATVMARGDAGLEDRLVVAARSAGYPASPVR